MKLTYSEGTVREVTETRAEHNERFNQPVPDEPDRSDLVGHVWDWFWHLGRRRMDIGPLTHQGIESWMNITKTGVKPWEVDMITAMDDSFLAEMSKERGYAKK